MFKISATGHGTEQLITDINKLFKYGEESL